MTKYCKSCGEPNPDDAIHCDSCGAKIGEVQEENKISTNSSNSKEERIEKLPFLLAIISMVIGIIECLTAPMLFGFYEIIGSLLVVVIGGVIGLYLLKKEENFIAALEFIAIAIVIFVCLSNMAFIGTIFFVVTAILTFYLKGRNYSSKKLFAIPVLTVVLVIAIFVAAGAVSFVSSQNSIEVGNITQDMKNEWGYYDGSVQGDIKVDSDFDYLEVHMDYYDVAGKVVESTIAWNELNVKGGETYHFSGMYFDEIQPTQCKITVVDSSSSTSPLYNQTINITTF